MRKPTARNFILVFILALVSLPLAMGANSETNTSTSDTDSNIHIELYFFKQTFVYIDKFIQADNHIIAQELYQRKINGSYQQKKEVMNKCLSSGGTFKNAVLYTMPLLESVVDDAIKNVDCDPVDSTISFDPDAKPMFTITREKPGRKVNEERLYMEIYNALLLKPLVRLQITPDSVTPHVTTYDNINLTKLRTRYSTNYAYSNENRKHNIKLSLKKVNGTVLKEGEEFSFNDIVGRRTEANGFKEAKIIVGGKYENGIGGGVCQASTTIYNAALLSGLKITAARSHSLECSYELPSFDAMVNANSSDLRFVNTEKSPVFLRAYGTEESAVVEVYGKPLEYTIRRKSETIYRKEPPGSKTEIDTEYKYHQPDAISGETKIVSYPHGEMKSAGYLLYYDQKGFLLKREKIREDTYKASEGLIAVAP